MNAAATYPDVGIDQVFTRHLRRPSSSTTIVLVAHELRHVDRMAVEECVAELQARGLGPSAVRQARQVLNNMMQLAVETGYMVVNPAAGVKTRRQPEPEMLFLTAEEVERLAAAIQQPYSTLVHVLAYGGLRWGEAAALRRKRC